MDKVLEKHYRENDNYFIRKNNTGNNLCYIYCSSNALFQLGNQDDFRRKVIEHDKYEWININSEIKPDLEIFIRDIWLSWYVKGINAEINSYEKLVEFLKGLTKGFEIRCVGASSGGFIGNILAMELNAEMSYSFAGQFSLRNHFDHLQNNPALRAYFEEKGDYWFEYYKRIPAANSKIIYLFPRLSEQDIEQEKLVEGMKNVLIVTVDEREHGVVMYPFALPQFLSYGYSDMKKLAEEVTRTKLAISIRVAGYLRFLKYCIHKVRKKIK